MQRLRQFGKVAVDSAPLSAAQTLLAALLGVSGGGVAFLASAPPSPPLSSPPPPLPPFDSTTTRVEVRGILVEDVRNTASEFPGEIAGMRARHLVNFTTAFARDTRPISGCSDGGCVFLDFGTTGPPATDVAADTGADCTIAQNQASYYTNLALFACRRTQLPVFHVACDIADVEDFQQTQKAAALCRPNETGFSWSCFPDLVQNMHDFHHKHHRSVTMEYDIRNDNIPPYTVATSMGYLVPKHDTYVCDICQILVQSLNAAERLKERLNDKYPDVVEVEIVQGKFYTPHPPSPAPPIHPPSAPPPSTS